MKRRLATLSMTLALLASCTKGPDPAVVDPKHYKVTFENDRVRVLHVMIGPREKAPMHYHPDQVTIALTADRVRVSVKGGETTEGDNKAGSTGMGDSVVHEVENIGDMPMERYIVEFKKR